jgi:CheY-like chemotaxis protein
MDITHHKQIEAELKVAKQKAESAARAEPEIGEVHLAMLSSSSFGDHQQRVMAECGILTYLLKPLRQFELRQLLQQVAEARDLASGSGGAAGPVEAGPALASVAGTGPQPVESDLPPEFPTPQPGEGKALRVLLAEDNEVNREIAVDMLKNLGSSVDCAENGVEDAAPAHFLDGN